MSNTCCPTDIKPAINNYKGTGVSVKVPNEFDMYVKDGGRHKNAVVVCYDIFGHTANVEQFADGLASTWGGIVAVPNLIEDPWPYKNVPPKKDGQFPAGVEPADGNDVCYNWIVNHPSCRQDRTSSLQAVKAHLREKHGIEKMALMGMCWGAKVAFVASKSGLADALAACHGSFLNTADVQQDIPMCLLNSKDEPESYDKDLKPILESKPQCVYKTFPTMHHGWMGTRGLGADTDFGQNEVVARYAEAMSDLTNFFHKAMA